MSKRARTRAAAVAAKHVATVPLAAHDDGHDDDDGCCFDCGQPWDLCECHEGAECGRWRNGVLSDSCSKAGSEECDFECPFSR
ncbi:hypothetical protein [Aquabacterium sp. OR-4]|uniref:hypothetical protein n=1 Tax=Aquabacterium sp. OR-4 TaxID=2978127 RepID=UPI0021B38642|nr:hypothetical protein [Aquabacterium sp. OR-4]MDT7835014.1 hypothetical protein [Aquabacterium sp. OR-4]